ncbi:hypothetical protein BMR10_10860 [Methylococcaceae bacterium CS4]|uniref:hypothetical protein n=1 Tax=Bathymodiolus platifrons methanotrophic gill symbiont TaxID=113268 RepID=UPI000B419BF0|nr:hypothetical protein [Bathymodiolus platifrons methanotrophic gill symbiont]TXK95265.1 hypothetical protein BMR10_10860 [Methylococcaceae bacterium CS4]
MINLLALLALVLSSVFYFKKPHSNISRFFTALFVLFFSLSGYLIGGGVLAFAFFVGIVLLVLSLILLPS